MGVVCVVSGMVLLMSLVFVVLVWVVVFKDVEL